MGLSGKTAIVTGASRGIGRAVAERLGADGANVVVDYNASEGAAQEVVNTITAAGGKAIAVKADISVPPDVLRLFDEAQAAFGSIDILVNNAGITVVGPTAHLPEADFDRAFALNVKGAFLAMQQAALRLNDNGRIVNISTGYVKAPNPYVGVYVATKAAVDQIGASLAKEVGERGITVNSVAPGLTDTDGVAPEVRAQADVYIGMTPLGRFGQPRDIADVVAFLASEESRWVTGQVISATGGLA
jgi:3-oxoacyl-[acyl-carrier protein] reductase